MTAGTSAVLSICFCNPVDVVKTRMALQMGKAAQPYRNVPQALYQIAATEGVAGLQRGLGPACIWQFSNVSVRFGVYALAKEHLGMDQAADGFLKWLRSLGLAAVSGAFAALASNPFFILKTRFQAGEPQQVSGGIAGAVGTIWRADGFAGFFRGLSAFAPRVIVASAVQLSTYDAIKAALRNRLELRDGLPLHTAASFVTGGAVVLAMQPFDFAATVLVSSKTASEQAATSDRGLPRVRPLDASARAAVAPPSTYDGPLDVIRQTMRVEGVRGIYRGAVANYLRFGPCGSHAALTCPSARASPRFTLRLLVVTLLRYPPSHVCARLAPPPALRAHSNSILPPRPRRPALQVLRARLRVCGAGTQVGVFVCAMAAWPLTPPLAWCAHTCAPPSGGSAGLRPCAMRRPNVCTVVRGSG